MTHIFTFIYALVLGYMLNGQYTLIECIFWPVITPFEFIGYLIAFVLKKIPALDAFVFWFKYVLLHRFYKVRIIAYLELYVQKYSSDKKFWNRKRAQIANKVIKLNQAK